MLPKRQATLYLLERTQFIQRTGEHMKSKILVVGFALLSVFAVAQSSSNQADSAKKSSEAKPRDAATGQASGKAAEKPADSQSVQTAREASSGMATGKVATTDKNDAQLKRVAAGDVNGDGKADAAATNTNGQNAASSSVKAPRDIATGQASGKRQHQPVLDSSATSSSSDSKEPAKK
jgi:hypothetical protein